MAQILKFRPSEAGRVVHCHGSVLLAEPYRDTPEGEDAALGNAAHHRVMQIATGVTLDDVAPNGIRITDEMDKHARKFIAGLERIAPLECWHIEKRLEIPGVYDGHGGTPDAWAYRTGIIYVRDFKYGFKIIEGYENWQMIDYGWGAYGVTPAPVTGFDFGIYQPRAPHPEGPYRTWQVRPDTLEVDYWPRLRSAANDPNPRTRTGPHCYRCPGRHDCSALREATAAALEFIRLPIPERLTGENLSAALDMLEMAKDAIKNYSEAIESVAKEALRHNPAAAPGWCLERGISKWNWQSEIDLTAVEKLTGLTLHKSVALTPKQAEEAGAPAPLIASYKTRAPGAPNLKKFNPKTIERKMGHVKSN